MTDRLDEVKDLIEQVPNLSDLAKNSGVCRDPIAEYRCPNGVVPAHRLLNTPEGSVKLAYLAEGCQLPHHRHVEQMERIVVLEGEIRVEVDGREPMTLYAGDMVEIPRMTRHTLIGLVWSKFIGIIIPNDPAYP